MFICLECGKKIKTPSAQVRAYQKGCSKCGSFDIDIYVPEKEVRKAK